MHYSPYILRSQNTGQLIIPRISKLTVDVRSFSYFVRKLWNSLFSVSLPIQMIQMIQLMNGTESTLNWHWTLNKDTVLKLLYSRIDLFASLNRYFPVYPCKASLKQPVFYKALYKIKVIWLDTQCLTMTRVNNEQIPHESRLMKMYITMSMSLGVRAFHCVFAHLPICGTPQHM